MCAALLEPRPGDTTDPNGTSPLHLAAKNGHIDIIRYGRGGRGGGPSLKVPAPGSVMRQEQPGSCRDEVRPLDAKDTSSCPHKGCAKGGWGGGFYTPTDQTLRQRATCMVNLWRHLTSLSLFPHL